MILSLFILLPLIVGFFLLISNRTKSLKNILLPLYLFLLGLFLYLVILANSTEGLNYKACWFSFNHINAYYALSLEGFNGLMVLLTSLVGVFLSFYLFFTKQKYTNSFYGLLSLSMAGLYGVFMAKDLVLFYLFWEIVLIPIYFLIGLWGYKKNRISNNIIFLLYTVLGSMFMLAGIIFIGYKLLPDSFLITDVMRVTHHRPFLGLFILFLIAFVIKIPLFPVHTWQPYIYRTSPTPVTVVMSALMAKMGIFAVVHWLQNLFPIASALEGVEIYLYILVFGLVYASMIAMTTKNIKKIIAYSSIAHLALIFIALFSNQTGITGAYFQSFSHGLVVLGLWLCIDMIERNYKASSIKSISGLASVNPTLAIFIFIFGLANIALPLTSSFIGEFMMLQAIFIKNPILCVIACLGVILSAVYTLRLLSAILFGKTSLKKESFNDHQGVYWVLALVALLIIILGVYPSPIFNFLTIK